MVKQEKSAANAYQIGQLVWAKMKGYPFWPATVIDPEDEAVAKMNRSRNKRSRYAVKFFGSENYAFFTQVDLQPFFANIKKFSKHSKKEDFAKGIVAVRKFVRLNPKVLEFEKDADHLDDEDFKQWLQETKDDDDDDDLVKSKARFPETNDEDDDELKSNASLDADIPVLKKRKRESVSRSSEDTGSISSSAPVSSTKLPVVEKSEQNGLISPPKMPTLNISVAEARHTLTKKPPTHKKFGFIGVGNIGSLIVQRLLNNGHHVVLCDVKEKPSEFASVPWVEHPKDLVEECDIIFSCVSSSKAVHEVVFGEHGIVAAQIGPKKAFVEFSTMDLQTAMEVHSAIVETGARYLEAPMTGSVKDARDGKMVFICSGDKSLFDELVTSFSNIGRKVLFMGTGSSATKVRLCLQLLFGTMTACVAETMALVERCDLDSHSFKEIVEMTNLNCQFIKDTTKAMIDGVFLPPDVPLGAMQSEIQHVVDLANQISQPTYVGAITNQLYISAKNKGEDRCDATAVFRQFSRN